MSSRRSRLSSVTTQRKTPTQGSDLLKKVMEDEANKEKLLKMEEEEQTMDQQEEQVEELTEEPIEEVEEGEETEEEEEMEGDENTEGDENISEQLLENVVVQEPIRRVMTPRTKRLAIDQELKDMNIKPMEKIVLKDDNTSSVKYIKANTNNGIPFWVLLDVDALVAVNSEDLNVKESDFKNINMPVHNLIDMKNIGMDIEGVAIECHNGICTKVRGKNFQTVPKMLTLDQQRCSKTGSSSCISKLGEHGFDMYPIVKYSDLKSNCGLVVDNIEKHSKKFKNELFIKSTEVLLKTEQQIDKLHKTYKESVKVVPAIAKNLGETINQLHLYEDEYKKKGINDKNKLKYEALLINIQNRNNLVSELVAIVSRLSHIGNMVSQATDEVELLSLALKKDFNNIDKDISGILKK
jgi:hypothetical protein